jgi:hypothetical protein
MAGNTTLTLGDVVNQLKINNKSQEKTNKNLENYFKYLERQRLDQLENQREMKKTAGTSTQRNASTGSGSSGWALNPSIVFNLLSGLGALAAAGLGLRGWEAGAIKNINQTFRRLRTNLATGLRNISLSALKALGIEKVQKRDPLGRFMKGKEWNIVQKVRLSLLRIQRSISNFFTPLISLGKSVDTSFKAGSFSKILQGVGKFLGVIFEGPISVLRYIGNAGKNLTTGALGKALSMFQGMGQSKIGDILKRFGIKILAFLKPIGFIFSAWEGIKSYQAKKGDMYDKLGAGIGGFLGDFFGGFMNLIKSAVSWILGKLGFKNAEKFLDGLDFNKMIKDLVEGIFAFGKKAVKWFELLFNDPKQALADLWAGTFGEDGFVNAFIWKPLSKAFDWITKKLGWRDEDAPPFDLYTTVSGWASSVKKWLSDTWASVKTFFVQLPERISLFFKEGWVKLMTDLEIGWVKLGAFITDLPNQILLGALNWLKKTMGDAAFGLTPMADMLTNAKSDAAMNASVRDQKITDIQGSRGGQLAEIESRRQALDSEKAKGAAPVVIQNGGSSSSNTTNAPVNVVMPYSNDLNASDPVIY